MNFESKIFGLLAHRYYTQCTYFFVSIPHPESLSSKFKNRDFFIVSPGPTMMLLIYKYKRGCTFDYIPLLRLSIPIEFALSNSLKTVPWASCKLWVEFWLHLDNRFLFLALFCTEFYFSFFNIYFNWNMKENVNCQMFL